MDFVNLPLFAAAALVFARVLAGLFSARIGFSLSQVFRFARQASGLIGSFYSLPRRAQTAMPLGFWIAAKLNRLPVMGNSVCHGATVLVARALQGNKISRSGLACKSEARFEALSCGTTIP